jgi:AmmeMemoRadiSam system radical SAM enzyme/AmmeMemoRadiSam system protein B/AmmeMemoRadiSam system protein A
LPDGAVLGGWWHDDPAEAGRIVCDLCPRACALRPGDRAFCFVRENRDGQMVLTTYGQSTGFCIDPIEKKPLNHFYPGTSVLSFGTAGCNLGCKFCQNWSISKSREIESLSESASPEAIAQAALKLGCKSVAFTYNDPVIWAEYAIDTAQACRAVGIKTVAVTAGYITPHSRGAFYDVMDAANVDLKGFTEEFYQKLTLSHLQPVLDTLVWLKRETEVWFEITNLIIPQANDSRDELARMCDWLYEHLGSDVPVHFTAFHPDFRLRDRNRTPAETLFAAHEIAVKAGLRYAYVGNLSDRDRQTTRCPQCHNPVIERASYEILGYAIANGACRHCGTKIPGRFDDAGGDWGSRRQPVRIAEFERTVEKPPQVLVQLGEGIQIRQSPAQPSMTPVAQGGSMAGAPLLSAPQQAAILSAAADVLAGTVFKRRTALRDPALAGAGQTKVMGCFVTAKRGGALRGCCGFMGTPTPIVEAVQRAASRTAVDDYRFPPISPSELSSLHLDVWLLFDPQPVKANGEARRSAVQIGKHGLQVVRGTNRGLLLPGVAIEHRLDAEAFLQHVCLKAGLPPHAWKDDDVQLSTFAGVAIEGPMPALELATAPAAIFTKDDIQKLRKLCRHNVLAYATGGTPTPYAFEAADGEAQGLVVSLRVGGKEIASATRFTAREGLPVQATLFGMCEQLAKVASGYEAVQVELAILDDLAIHGPANSFDARGYDPAERGLVVMGRGKTSFVWDAELHPAAALAEATFAVGLRPEEESIVYSARVVASTSPLVVAQRPQPQSAEGVRQAAVAGTFYPSDPGKLTVLVEELLAGPPVEKKRCPAVMVPHAGLKYSGKIAADVLRRVELPPTIIVIGPKHTPHGVDWAIAPHATWSIPGGTIAADVDLAGQLASTIEGLELDAAAHAKEHAIEVELPLLARLAPNSKVVGIAIGRGDFEDCRRFAQGLAQVIRQQKTPPLLVVSTDMNHFASDAENRRLDELALACIDRLDSEALLSTCRKQHISMCGVLPAVIVMETLRELGQLGSARRIAYGTSGDISGELSRVVGYAGVVFRAPAGL